MALLKEFTTKENGTIIGVIKVPGYGKFMLLNIDYCEYLLSDTMLDEYEKEHRFFDRNYFIDELLDDKMHHYNLDDKVKYSIYDMICSVLEAKRTSLDLAVISSEIANLRGDEFSELNYFMLTLSKINLQYFRNISRGDLKIFKDAIRKRKIVKYEISKISKCYITTLDYENYEDEE